MKKLLYYLLEKFVMTDFTDLIISELNKRKYKDEIIIFDIIYYIYISLNSSFTIIVV